MASDALVIGAGVSGLTTAIRLAEAGLTVRLIADRPPLRTTSADAGASWGPPLGSDDRRQGWSEHTRRVLEQIATVPGSGVALVPGVEAAPMPLTPPAWARRVPDFRLCTADELPAGYIAGWRYTIPVVHMPTYLGYLQRRLAEAGTTLELTDPVRSLAAVAGSARVIVNCTGMGARELVPDDLVYPIRGQLVIVDNPGIDAFFQDHAPDDQLTYIMPHRDHCVLGGTYITGSADRSVDPAAAAAILARCTAVEPRLHGVAIRDHRVGLRPHRDTVRVERGDAAGTPVVHNYGHGGVGVTLSWGCAEDVAALTGLLEPSQIRPPRGRLVG